MLKNLVRLIVLSVFLYEWNCRLEMMNKFPPDHPFNARKKYGGEYRFLTVLNYLLSIVINMLLLLGVFIPKGEQSIYRE